jgi:hypothetical protein
MEYLDNKYVTGFLTLVVVLYASMIGPELPNPVKDLFKNSIFKILILFLVVVKGAVDPSLALIIAIAFVLTLDFIAAKEAKEAFDNCGRPGGCSL